MTKIEKIFASMKIPGWVMAVAALGRLPLPEILYLFLATLVMTGSETIGFNFFGIRPADSVVPDYPFHSLKKMIYWAAEGWLQFALVLVLTDLILSIPSKFSRSYTILMDIGFSAAAVLLTFGVQFSIASYKRRRA